MSENIKLQAPQEVQAQLRRMAALLKLYEEGVQEEADRLPSLGQRLEEVKQTLVRRRAELQVSLEQVRPQAERSEAARVTQRSLEQRLAACEDLLQALVHHRENYEGICQDMSAAQNKARQLAGSGGLLSGRAIQLLDKLIDLM